MPERVWHAELGRCEICKRFRAVYRAVIVPHDDDDYELWCWKCVVEMRGEFELRPAGHREGPVRRGVPGPLQGTV